jgi:flagellar basal body P-ring formation protein FlgA
MQTNRQPATTATATATTATHRAALVALVLTVTSAAAAPAEWQPPESIRLAAETYALELLSGRPGVSVEVVAIDDRLKLPRCTEPLTATSDGPLANGRGTVSVSCPAERSWKLFVPVRTAHDVDVVVASSSVQRGHVLGPDDLRLERRPSSAVPYQYLTSLDEALGYTVRRTLPSGSVVAPASLEKPEAVRRGAPVTLVTGRAGVTVHGEGVALESAGLGDRIRVRTPVGRVIEGTVEADSRVRVGG